MLSCLNTIPERDRFY